MAGWGVSSGAVDTHSCNTEHRWSSHLLWFLFVAVERSGVKLGWTSTSQKLHCSGLLSSAAHVWWRLGANESAASWWEVSLKEVNRNRILALQEMLKFFHIKINVYATCAFACNTSLVGKFKALDVTPSVHWVNCFDTQFSGEVVFWLD